MLICNLKDLIIILARSPKGRLRRRWIKPDDLPKTYLTSCMLPNAALRRVFYALYIINGCKKKTLRRVRKYCWLSPEALLPTDLLAIKFKPTGWFISPIWTLRRSKILSLLLLLFNFFCKWRNPAFFKGKLKAPRPTTKGGALAIWPLDMILLVKIHNQKGLEKATIIAKK